MTQSSLQTPPSGEYARDAVPEEKVTSGLHLALIIIGGTIGFAIFIVAAQIGGSLGYVQAGKAFALGSLILGIMGAMTSYVGARSRLSTYLLTEFAFGRAGAKVVNLVIALSLIGWYGVISNTLGHATQSLFLESFGIAIPTVLAISIASALMIWVTVLGFTGIDRLALILVPFMGLFILFAAFLSLRQGEAVLVADHATFTFKTAVSAVVGSYIAGVIIQPDYSRFAVNVKQAVWAVFIALGVVFPAIQFFSAVPSMAMGEADIIQVMLGLGIMIPAFFLLFLGAWSSNVLCLYSSGLSIATIAERAPLSKIIIGAGILGTAIAFLPSQTYLISFLVLLGVTIPPIGAIYIIETILLRRFDMSIEGLRDEPPVKIEAFIAWGLAAGFGYMSSQGIASIIGIGSLDSLLVSSLVYLALNYKRLKQSTPG